MNYFGKPRVLGEPLGFGGQATSLDTYFRNLAGLVEYLPLNEISGAAALDYSGNGFDGVHTNNTIADDTFAGRPCPTFDGVNDSVERDEVGIETVFNPDLGTAYISVKMAEADLNSTTTHGFISTGVDNNNRLNLGHSGAVDRISIDLRHGGTNIVLNDTVAQYDTWLFLAASWSRADARTRLYIGGQARVTGAFPTAGTWSASDLAALYCTLGHVGGGSDYKGSLASYAMVNREITQAEFDAAYIIAKSQENNMA